MSAVRRFFRNPEGSASRHPGAPEGMLGCCIIRTGWRRGGMRSASCPAVCTEGTHLADGSVKAIPVVGLDEGASRTLHELPLEVFLREAGRAEEGDRKRKCVKE